MEDRPTDTSPAPAPANVDWDYEMTVPTQWRIRGRNPTMHIVSEEQIEALASSGNPWPQNFCFFAGGIAAALLIQLKSGVADPASRQILWLAFFVMTILTAFFAVLAGRDYIRTARMKREIKRQAPTVQAEAPTVRTQAGKGENITPLPRRTSASDSTRTWLG